MTAKKNTGGTYIFLGPEAGRKKAAIEGVRKKISVNGTYEETVLYADEMTADQITGIVQNRSLFTELRLFIIKNAELIKKDKEVSLIASCIKNLEPGTTLILFSDANKLSSGLDNICPKENRKVYYELSPDEKSDWVFSCFRNEGYNIDPDGIETILELVENDTEILQHECSRIMSFFTKDRSIRADDIEEWLSHSREETASSLFSRIAAGDFSKAAESLHSINENPKYVFAGLMGCFKNLREYLAFSGNGESSYSIFLKMRVFSPKAKEDLINAASRYTPGGVDNCLALTAEYDLRTSVYGTAWKSVLMDMYLLKILQLGNK